MNENEFSRIIPLFPNFEDIKKARVALVGLGGVGGTAAIALARSGISHFVLCDFDKVNITNFNRQIIANYSTIGEYKVDCIEKMIKDINKDAEIIKIKEPFNNESTLFNYKFDYLIDAIDDVDNKYLLIKETIKRNITLISSMGTAKKLDIKKLNIIDINKTTYDPLAKIIRKKMRDEGLKLKFMCLSSTEEVKLEGRYLASYMPVTSTSGLMIADYIIKKIGETKNE